MTDDHAPLRRLLAEHLGAGGRSRVVVVTDPAGEAAAHDLATWTTAQAPGAHVTVRAETDAEDRHVALAAHGPYDVVVDPTGAGGARARFGELLMHLDAGGVLLMAAPPAGGLQALVRQVGELRASGELEPPRAGRDGRRNPERDRHALAATCAEIDLVGDVVVAVADAPSLAKVPELAMNTLLASRPATGRVLETVPGRRWAARAVVRHSEADVPPRTPASYDAPELSLREYRDVVCLPRQVAVQDHLVLPDSYRHHAKPRLRNQALVEWAPRFARMPEHAEPRRLDGSFFYLDNHVRGHFGHALTEQVSHLWGWTRAKERDPSLKALVCAWKEQPEVAEWELELLEAGGVSRGDVVVADGPVRVETLVAASPMFSMPDVLHPAIGETYDRIGAALAARAAPTRLADPAERVFLTRRGRKRACHQGEQVEGLFAAAGFAIVLPEELSLPEQVALVRGADVVAGFSGSAMFQTAFSGRPQHVVLVGSESYTASNEHMIASVLGHRLDLVLCRPDVPRAGRFSVESYQSDFTFDPAREGRFLDEVLAGL